MTYFIGFISACAIFIIVSLVYVIRKQNKQVRQRGVSNKYFSPCGEDLYELNQFRYQFDDERKRDLDNIIEHANYLLEEQKHFDYPKNHPIFAYIRTLTMKFQTENDLNVLKQKGDRIRYKISPNNSDSLNYTSAHFEFLEEIMTPYRLNSNNTIKLKTPLTIELSKAPIISRVWRDDRLLDALLNIGSDVQEKNNYLVDLPLEYELKTMDFKQDNMNHLCAYIYPLGFVYAYNGNHSINAGIIKAEGKLNIDEIYDVSEMYNRFEFNGTYLFDNDKDEHHRIPFELGALFELGRILKGYIHLFPKEVQESITEVNSI